MAKIVHQSVDSDMRIYQNIKPDLDEVKASLAEKATKKENVATTTGRWWSSTLEEITETINSEKRLIQGKPLNYKKKVVVFGSSTAEGYWATDMNGWQQRLNVYLTGKNVEVINRSISGNTAVDAISRFYTDVVAVMPDFVIIALTLGNETNNVGGTGGNYETGAEQLKTNIIKIANMAKQHGIIPIIASQFVINNNTATSYKYQKQVNKQFESMGFHTINLLGAFDNLSGIPVTGTAYDGLHPNDIGHEALFKAIPPSMFENLTDAHSSIRSTEQGAVLLTNPTTDEPMTFVPSDPIDTFTVFLRIRASVNPAGDRAFLGFSNFYGPRLYTEANMIVYNPDTGSANVVRSTVSVTDKKWHSVALSHNIISQETRLYVDGVYIGNSSTIVIPLNYMIVGSRLGASNSSQNMEFKDVLLYRSRLTDDEIKLLDRGKYLKGSLELFAPLSDMDVTRNSKLINLAPTKSFLKVNTDNLLPVTGGISSVQDYRARRIDMVGGGSFFIDTDGALKYESKSGTITTIAPA